MKCILTQLLFLFWLFQISFAQNQSCPEYIQPIGGITNGTFKANNTVSSNGIILQNNHVEFKAGELIRLQSGFSTNTNTNFSANVENCNYTAAASANSLTFNNFPQSVSEGANYTVDVDYQLLAPGLLHLILADENWNKIGEVWTGNLPAGSFTESLNFTVTGTPSSNTNYLQVNLLNTNWEVIGVDMIQQTIVGASDSGITNSIDWINFPQSLNSGTTYTVDIEYSAQQSSLIYMLIMDESWQKIGEVWQNSLSTGSHTISLPITLEGIPSQGNNYIQAQLLNNNWESIGVDNIQETIAGNATVNSSSLAWENIPDFVSTGSSYPVDIAYSATEPGLIYLILMDNNWNKIGEEWVNIDAGTGIESMVLEVTGNHSAGNNYLQASLFNVNWEEVGAEMIYETIVGGGSGINELNWANFDNLPSAVQANENYTIEIDYSLNVPGLVYLQLMDANWQKIGEVWTNTLNPGSGTASLQLEITGSPSSGNNYLQAQLFNSNWESIGIQAIQQTVTNSNMNAATFGLISTNDPPLTEYHTIFPLVNNSDYNTFENGNPNPKNKQLTDAANSNALYGYASNWFVGAAWQGPIKAFFGPVSEAGGQNFWMEWENQQQPNHFGYTDHAETDVRVQKHQYAWGSSERGYPKKLSEINANNIDVTCTANGQWTTGSAGRAHINLTVWIGSTNNIDIGERSDIIIHAWDNSGNMSANSNFDLIGTINSGGFVYDVIQRSGDFGEAASFNIVPRLNGQTMVNRPPILGNYPNSATIATNYSISVMDFINWLKDNAKDENGNPVFDNNWWLAGADWTITAQSANTVDGKDIPASKGRWTFNNYFIPDLE